LRARGERRSPEGFELRRRIFEFLVLDQLPDQLPARVLPVVLVLGLRLLVHRQQLAALDIHERGGHDQELAGHLEVQQPHGLDVLDKLARQARQVDLVNVHLLLLDQVKEQVERAFKDLEFYFILTHGPRPLRAVPELVILV
jgi:hypothetical protein